MSLQWCSWTHTCAAYLINAAMLHKVSWWKHGIRIINISNRSSCNYTSPWHSVSASQKNNSCGRLLRHRWCLIEELINETSRRPFNGDEFPWHRSEAPIVSLWNYETQMISFFFLSAGGELSIHWHRAVGYWILGVFTSITRLPDKEQAWWSSESGGSCVPQRGFHMYLTGRGRDSSPDQPCLKSSSGKAISRA